MPDDDAILLGRAANHDVAAFRTLLERFGPQIWNEINADIAAKWRSLVDADDVMQVTYVEAFLQMDRLTARDAGGFVSWIRRIAKNNLHDAIKALERKKRPESGNRVQSPTSEESYVALVDVLGQTSTTPSRHVAAAEACRAVNEMLERLPPDYAQVIRLYDLESRNVADVAAAMGRSTGAVHMLKARAHDQLRSLLGAETDFFSKIG